MGVRYYNCDGCGEIVSSYDEHYTFNIDGFDVVCSYCGGNASDYLKLVEAPLLSFNFNKKQMKLLQQNMKMKMNRIKQNKQVKSILVHLKTL